MSARRSSPLQREDLLLDRTRTRAPYTRAAALGLVLAAAAPLLVFAAGLVAGLGLGGDAAYFLVVAAVALVGAFLVSRFGTWARIVSLVVSVLVGGAVFWMAMGLSYPVSFADFVPGVLLPLGVLLGAGGSIAALVANRRGRTRTEPSTAERGLIRAALAIVGLAVVASAVLSFTAVENVDSAAAQNATEATMRDLAFTEGTYRIAAGSPSTILVRNADPYLHTFTIPSWASTSRSCPAARRLSRSPPSRAPTPSTACRTPTRPSRTRRSRAWPGRSSPSSRTVPVSSSGAQCSVCSGQRRDQCSSLTRHSASSKVVRYGVKSTWRFTA